MAISISQLILKRPFATVSACLLAIEWTSHMGWFVGRLVLPMFLSHDSLVVRARAYAALQALGVAEESAFALAVSSWENSIHLHVDPPSNPDDEVISLLLTGSASSNEYVRKASSTQLLYLHISHEQLVEGYLRTLRLCSAVAKRGRIKYYWPAIIKEEAAFDLGDLGRVEAIPALTHMLSDEALYWRARYAAAYSLGRIGTSDSVEVLLYYLRDRTYAIRAICAQSLGRIRDKRAVEHLINSLNDPIFTVKAAAARALGSLGDNRAAKPLLARLKSVQTSLSPQAIREALKGDLAFDSRRLDDKGQPLRARMSKAEWDEMFNHNRTLHLLQQALYRFSDQLAHEELGEAYAEALGNLKASEAVETMSAMLSPSQEYLLGGSPNCFIAAIKALGRIGDPRAVQSLLDLIQPPFRHNVDVQWAAINALHSIGDIRAVPLLEPYLHKPWLIEIPEEIEKPECLFHRRWISATDGRIKIIDTSYSYRSPNQREFLSEAAARALVGIAGERAFEPLKEKLNVMVTSDYWWKGLDSCSGDSFRRELRTMIRATLEASESHAVSLIRQMLTELDGCVTEQAKAIRSVALSLLNREGS